MEQMADGPLRVSRWARYSRSGATDPTTMPDSGSRTAAPSRHSGRAKTTCARVKGIAQCCRVRTLSRIAPAGWWCWPRRKPASSTTTTSGRSTSSSGCSTRVKPSPPEALESRDISLEAARARVEAIVGQGSSSPSGHIPFTPRAKKALEHALREALQLGDHFIGTEHLLLGLLREGRGVAIQVLEQLGADLGQVREQVIEMAADERTERRSPAVKPDIQPASSSYVSLLHCSFCNEPQDQVTKLVAGPGVYICDRCIALCQEILDQHLPGNSDDLRPTRVW